MHQDKTVAYSIWLLPETARLVNHRKERIKANHFHGLHCIHHPLKVGNDLARVVVWHAGRVACPNAVRPVDQHQWQDGAVPLGLNTDVVIGEEVELVVVGWVEG